MVRNVGDLKKTAHTDVKKIPWPTPWVTTVSIIVLFALAVYTFWSLFSTVWQPIVPYLLAITVGTGCGYLYVKQAGALRAEKKRKAVKLAFDIAWNTWSFIGFIFLLKTATDAIKGNETEILGISITYPKIFTLVAMVGFCITLGRVVIATCDYFWEAPKPEDPKPERKKPGEKESAPATEVS